MKNCAAARAANELSLQIAISAGTILLAGIAFGMESSLKWPGANAV
jgi:hypothetical protein